MSAVDRGRHAIKQSYNKNHIKFARGGQQWGTPDEILMNRTRVEYAEIRVCNRGVRLATDRALLIAFYSCI